MAPSFIYKESIMWQALIGPVSNLVGTFLKNKAAEKQAVHESKMRRIEADADWE